MNVNTSYRFSHPRVVQQNEALSGAMNKRFREQVAYFEHSSCQLAVSGRDFSPPLIPTVRVFASEHEPG